MNKKSSNKENINSYKEMNSKNKYSNQNDEKDSEKKSNYRDKSEKNSLKTSEIKIYTKRNIFIFFIPLFIFISIYLVNNNPSALELKEKIKELELKIETLEKKMHEKKIGIAFVYEYLYVDSVARYITVLSDLLVKTVKYDVYLINEQAT